jgi:hypothetical protein
MALQTASTSLSPQDAYNMIRSNAASVKAQAQNALLSLQGGSVQTGFIFSMLDQLSGIIAALNTWKLISGLDSYATAQGYTGSLAADCGTCSTAATACISWVVQNFPASGGFLQAESINADGSRTQRSFTSVQTAGLQTNLQAFIATIG